MNHISCLLLRYLVQLAQSDKPGVQVFAGLKEHLLSSCTVRVSYLEIYNEQCYDLLDISAQPSDIAIIEDNKDRVIVKGLVAPVVDNEAEALQHLFEVRHPCVASHTRNLSLP